MSNRNTEQLEKLVNEGSYTEKDYTPEGFGLLEKAEVYVNGETGEVIILGKPREHELPNGEYLETCSRCEGSGKAP